MAHQINRTNFLLTKSVFVKQTKQFSKCVPKEKSSKFVRQTFLNYFINQHSYTFVRSSPVAPFYDPTVPFVNAGMNQFKGIFLGTKTTEHCKVANSQKCIRIGGKHNDLNVVGTDGYHHTFFEMLGSWTFGQCHKKEVCELCWNLLTQVYKIHPSRLYVTYFKGNSELNLEADLECKEVWRSIGIPEDRILPFGIQENFWEMGLTGPCGPCTEIHIDRLGNINRSKFVNKGLHDLTELWNIVFIQFNKNLDGTVKSLSQKHIDTGMGFERLVAVMQDKISNYNTDIFVPLFIAIEKICKGVPNYEGHFGEKDWNGLDTAYRIVADHARMVTACLADGMIPEQNQKLRRIIRRAFRVSESNFKNEKGLLKELTNYVVESLGCVYPEMEKNIKQIQQIIDYEEEVYISLKTKAAEEWEELAKGNPALLNLDVIEMPGLIMAYKEIKKQNIQVITPKLAYKLYDTYGLDEDIMSSLTEALNIKFNAADFRKEFEEVKMKSKEQSILNNSQTNLLGNLKPTDDHFKYEYEKKTGKYVFKELEVQIENIICNDNLVEEIESNVDCSLILNRTNFYTESGGQIGDMGKIKFKKGTFEVRGTNKLQSSVLHHGVFKTERKNALLKPGDTGKAQIDEELRVSLMRNHTGVHLLNNALKQLKGVTCQKSSDVNGQFLSFDVGVFGEKLNADDLKELEVRINKVIRDGVEVKTTIIDGQKLLEYTDVALIPGEVYPEEGIRLVEIIGKDDFVSREPCCGTHVRNTSDLQEFYIVSFKSLGRSTASLRAVTGPIAKLANQNGVRLLDEVTKLQKKINDNIDKPEVLEAAVTNLRKKLKEDGGTSALLPIAVKLQCLGYLNCINKQIKQIAKGTLNEFVEIEMQNVLQTNKCHTQKNQQYVVHYLRCSMILDSVPLQKATKLCPDLPILVIAYSDGLVKARCCVPEKLAGANFNAEKWLQESINKVFRSNVSAPRGQNPAHICNMKAKKINIQEWDTLLKESLEAAKDYVEKYL